MTSPAGPSRSDRGASPGRPAPHTYSRDRDSDSSLARVSDVPVVTFLSDYGDADGFAGICRGVIATICPAARVLDISHEVSRHDVRAGALILRAALPYMPAGVHLAVVDPDVGAQRRAIALRAADGRLLVGPDNGLLSLAARDAGGVTEAVEIGASKWRLEPVSATFHGRDIFAPVAARLAAGERLAGAGVPCDPAELVALELPRARIDGGALVSHAVYVDRFGNVQLDAGHDDIQVAGLKLGHGVLVGRHEARFVRTFADAPAGELLLYEDSARMLAVAVSHGSAAERLGVAAGDELRIAEHE
jgi:S-adenosylmethionine hydrolase